MNAGIFAPEETNKNWLKFLVVVGYVWIVFGLLFLFVAIQTFLQGHNRTHEDLIFQWVYLLFAGIFSVAGIGLIAKSPWGKVAGIVGSCFSLLAFPVGTIGGVLVMLGLRKNQATYREK